MSSHSHTTTSHEEIQKWVEKHKGKPATVKSTESKSGAGLLRIVFDEKDNEELEPISWEAFFTQFDESKLAFLYQDQTSDGKESRFFKFVHAES